MHFTRLRAYGCNVVRLLVTWEAIEHEGPGKHDEEYLKYMAGVVECAAKHEIRVYIDPHQDVYSRFSGGDGAPAWTFAAVGLDVTHFVNTGAALVHPTFPDPDRAANFPRMAWATNLHKLACGTMFALFWAGETLAPKCTVDGENIQHYLQRHYIASMAKLAGALAHCPNVIGFGTMNEPLPGFAGLPDVSKRTGPLQNYLMPTPFQSMCLGAGFSVDVPLFKINLWGLMTGRPAKHVTLNSAGESAWLPGRSCVWREHGVWDVDEAGQPRLLQPAYFASASMSAAYVPFAKAYMSAVRSAGHQKWLAFVELPPVDLGLPGADMGAFPKLSPEALPGIVHAPHWYDQLTLFFGHYLHRVSIDARTGKLALGAAAVRHLQAEQVHELTSLAESHLGGVPTLIGEFGIPFDLQRRELYNKGRARNAVRALERSVGALEANGSSYTLWCYAPEHAPAHGDQWNREDLSIYSASHAAELTPSADPAGVYTGGRALKAFVRPYATAICGTFEGAPLFNMQTREYKLCFRHDASEGVAASGGVADAGGAAPPPTLPPTLVFIPVAVHYPDGYDVLLSDGSYTVEAAPAERGGYHVLSYAHTASFETHTLVLRPKGAKPERTCGCFASKAHKGLLRVLPAASPAQAHAEPA